MQLLVSVVFLAKGLMFESAVLKEKLDTSHS